MKKLLTLLVICLATVGIYGAASSSTRTKIDSPVVKRTEPLVLDVDAIVIGAKTRFMIVMKADNEGGAILLTDTKEKRSMLVMINQGGVRIMRKGLVDTPAPKPNLEPEKEFKLQKNSFARLGCACNPCLCEPCRCN